MSTEDLDKLRDSVLDSDGWSDADDGRVAMALVYVGDCIRAAIIPQHMITIDERRIAEIKDEAYRAGMQAVRNAKERRKK